VRLFLDTSVLLSACASASGASRALFRHAAPQRWTLISTSYVNEEVLTNLPDFPAAATAEWARLRLQLLVLDDVLTSNRPVVFPVAKDRPVLLSAAAWADVLLTLDKGDFAGLLGHSFYELRIMRPGQFLSSEREAGRLPTI
jgi:predicted nucleic acid-binding protein